MSVKKYWLSLFIWFQYFWELYIETRQYRLCKNTTTVPSPLSDVISREKFDGERSNMIEKHQIFFIQGFFSVFSSTMMIHSGLLSNAWTYAVKFSPWEGEVILSCIWLFLLSGITAITDLPVSACQHFVIEQNDFNEETAKVFILNKLESFFYSQCVILPICSIAVMTLENNDRLFFLSVWICTVTIIILIRLILPSYVVPVFDNYRILPEGELRSEIEVLAEDLDFPLKNVYIVNESQMSLNNKVLCFGFSEAQYIILSDTLLQNSRSGGCKNDEILAVLSHEIGHWKYNHTLKLTVLNQISLFLNLCLYSFMIKYPPIYIAVGFPEDVQPALAGMLAVVEFLSTPLTALLRCIQNYVSQHFVLESDAFVKGLEKHEPLERALLRVFKEKAEFPVYDNLFSKWHHSHPPLLQRLAALRTN
ncbi:hypothetical protein FQA39_LY18454 [Lamprigera yunnana]|nr:hypothetical protein FQA39_LY18454 [Lamprigera yunnana]